jgi:hypothetical protein
MGPQAPGGRRIQLGRPGAPVLPQEDSRSDHPWASLEEIGWRRWFGN